MNLGGQIHLRFDGRSLLKALLHRRLFAADAIEKFARRLWVNNSVVGIREFVTKYRIPKWTRLFKRKTVS